MTARNKEQHETITVTVQYEVKINATGATHDERKKCAESLAGTRLTKHIGCKLISAKAKSAKPKKSGKVTTICYGKRDTWNSPKDAIDYFNNAANCSDGCERERYLTIVSKLVDGETKDVTDSFD